MDRQVAILAALMLGLAMASLSIGCKTADEGPRPFVMPARPVMNVPIPEPTGSPPYPPQELIPTASTERSQSFSKKTASVRPRPTSTARKTAAPTYLR